MNWSSLLQSKNWPSGFVIPAPQAPLTEWEEAARALFPGMAEALAATPQDPVYHAEGDVWTHTKMVVSALLASPVYAAQPPSLQGVLFYAALLHDIAKPQTTREDGGKIIAPGHSPKGAIQARVALWEAGVDPQLREQVCRLIEYHQVPFFAFNSRKGVSAEYTARLLAQNCSIELLTAVAEADMRGRVCNDQQAVLVEIELFAELAREMDCFTTPYSFPDAPTRMAYFLSGGNRYPDEKVFVKDPFEVTILCGLPASGKSTYAAALPKSVPVVSYDDLREELGLKHGEGTGTIVHAADDRMRELLRSKTPFVVNATHLSRQMRRRTVGLARDYGASVRALYFEATFPETLARNAARDTSLKTEKLLRMTGNWEVPGEEEFEVVEWNASPPRFRPAP
jgi:predicted kinase